MNSYLKKFFILFSLILISSCQILPNQSQDTQVLPEANNSQILKDKKINADEEKKKINITVEEISGNNKGKSTAINKVITRNKFEKIFEQTLGEKFNSAKIEIIKGEHCEPLKMNEMVHLLEG